MSSNDWLPVPAGEPPKGLVDWVSERLRDAILLGDMAPGERVRTTQLARDLEVSATPVREAIQRLTSEGLLDAQAQQGARVSQVSVQRALEIFELRAVLEPLLVRLSVQHFTEAHCAVLVARFDEYVQAWEGKTVVTPDMSRKYLRFFDALASGGDLPHLRSMVRNLKLQALRYNDWFAPADRIDIHRRAADAALAGDADAAMIATGDAIRPGIAWARQAMPDNVEATEILTSQSVVTFEAIATIYAAPGGIAGRDGDCLTQEA